MFSLSTDLKLNIFRGVVFFIHLCYLALFFGVAYFDETYVNGLNSFIQLGVSLFLFIRFFPLKTTHDLTKLDIFIIFYCSTLLLLNIAITQIYHNIIVPINKIEKYALPNLVDTVQSIHE